MTFKRHILLLGCTTLALLAAPLPAAHRDKDAPDRRGISRQRDWDYDDPLRRSGGYGESYPGAEIRAVPPAAANAARTRVLYRQAVSQLEYERRQVRRDFETTAEYKRALNDEEAAYQAYEASRRRTLNGLRDNPDYVAIQELIDDLSRKIADERAQRKPDPKEIEAMATLKLRHAARLRAMENALLASNPQLEESRQRSLAAAQRLDSMRSETLIRVSQQPQVVAARDAMFAAYADKRAARAYLDSARTARDLALDYGYSSLYVSRFRPYLSNVLVSHPWGW